MRFFTAFKEPPGRRAGAALALLLAAGGCGRSIPADPTSPDPDFRWAAATALRGRRDPASIEQLRALLADDRLPGIESNELVRGTAARSLGFSGLPEVVPALAAALEGDAAPGVRVDAAVALGDLGLKEGAPALRAAAARPDQPPGVRRAAAESLGRLRDRESLPILIQALRDPDRSVQLKARDALTAICGEDLGKDPAAWEAWDKANGRRSSTP